MRSFLRWLPLLGLVVAGALVLYGLRPPRPLPTTAPAIEFAATRIAPDLDSLARQPHALGTAAHAQVRRYLLRRLRTLGLQPRVQDTTLLLNLRGQPTLAHVQNVVGRQPGIQAGGRAVLVLAHYDSQPHAPGAGDDAAGVAALLEAIRVLRAGPPLLHDVEWLFTDGEEADLLGARAYAADTARLRRRVGVALNFEGRGNAGPSLTFEVSPQNGWLMREYAQVVPAPLASSLFYEVYRRLPNDTDFTPLREAGVSGLNFAFVGGFSYYHSPADTPAHLDLASVQHHGSYLLSLVRHFANGSLAATKAPDCTFFSVPGLGLLRYPAAWSLPLVGAAALLLLLVAAVAQQQRRLAWGGLLGGALAWLGGLVLVIAADWGLLAAVRALYPQYQAFYAGTFYNSLAYQAALLALGLAVWGWYYGQLSCRLRADTLVGGALLVVLALAAALTWAAPTSAYVLTWPLLASTLAWGFSQLRQPGQPAGGLALAVAWLLSLPAVGLLVPLTALLLVIFGLGPPVLIAGLMLALGLGLLLPLLLPVLQRPGRTRPAATGRPAPQAYYLLPLLGLAGAAGALVWGQFTSRPTPAQPQQTHLYYFLNAATHQAYWLSALPQPDAWTRAVLGSPLASPAPAGLPGHPAQWQPAPPLPLAAPQALVLADTLLGTQRRLTLRLLAGRAASTSLLLRLPDTTTAALPLAVRVAGQLVPARALSQAGLLLLPPAPGGTTLELVLRPRAHLRLELLGRTLGLPPAAGAPALPATFVPAPGYNSFTTQVRQAVGL
ncbi:MAG: M20/M25/M40 family metallo-hydrolase [Janthinobacterium lividum]